MYRVDVDAGITEGTVEVAFEADTLDELPFKPVEVVASPLRGMAVADNRGKARVADDDADVTPLLTALRSPVDSGGRIGYRLRLSAPRDDFYIGQIEAVVTPGVPQIRTTDVPFEWKRFRLPDPNRKRPLSLALAHSFEFFFLEEGQHHTDLTIPTLDRPLDVTRRMTIRVNGSAPATIRLR